MNELCNEAERSHEQLGAGKLAAAAKLLQSCPTLCDPIDSSPPGFPVPGILQARTLEWVSISVSNAWKWKVKVKLLSCVRLFGTPWTAAYQAPLSMGFSRQQFLKTAKFPHFFFFSLISGLPRWLSDKESTCQAGDMGLTSYFFTDSLSWINMPYYKLVSLIFFIFS